MGHGGVGPSVTEADAKRMHLKAPTLPTRVGPGVPQARYVG
jgi:hypothetical protein